MKKRNYTIQNNRYERYLNILCDKTWNGMSKTGWELYKFVCARFGKSNESTGN